MRIVHVLLPAATRFDRARATIDITAGPDHEHVLYETERSDWLRNGSPSSLDALTEEARSSATDLLHLHGAAQPPRRVLAGLGIPWITDRHIELPRTLFRRMPPPKAVLMDREVPESVPECWFVRGRVARPPGPVRRVGTYVRSDAVRNNVEQAAGRIQRFRDDVEWIVFDRPPSPDDFAGLDVWVDPAADEDDLDGMVAEAIACLTPVVAAKTAMNFRLLDGGKAGLLPPLGDHNEMTHAVVNVLFKNEVAAPLRNHAESIRDRFRPEQRRSALERIYAEVVG